MSLDDVSDENDLDEVSSDQEEEDDVTNSLYINPEDVYYLESQRSFILVIGGDRCYSKLKSSGKRNVQGREKCSWSCYDRSCNKRAVVLTSEREDVLINVDIHLQYVDNEEGIRLVEHAETCTANKNFILTHTLKEIIYDKCSEVGSNQSLVFANTILEYRDFDKHPEYSEAIMDSFPTFNTMKSAISVRSRANR